LTRTLEVKNGQIRGFRNFITAEVTAYLKGRPDQKFGAREIAEYLVETHPQLREYTLETSDVVHDEATLVNRLVARISQFRNGMPGVRTTEGRPRKFYYTDKTAEAEVREAEVRSSPTSTPSTTPLKEHDLYPMLSEFLWTELGLYSKRIDEKRSRNSRGPGGNKWLYPDIVGMEDLSADWNGEIKDCVKQYADKKTKLWSFEVKILINRSNVREVFFQAVSNSSWANFAYLAASQISEDGSMKELRLLSSLHGVGIIRLNPETPSESEILIPARERIEIDWNNANRLAEENSDFLKYIKLIRQFYQTGDVRPADWDIPQED
jgi:hypothetical protein